MYQSQSVRNLENRNLDDLRVYHRPGSVRTSTERSTSNLVLDIPILSFEDNLFPGSPCPNVSLMESPHLYEVGIEDILKKTFTSSIDGVNNSEDINITNLDPVFENTVDISQLLNATNIPEETLEQLIFNPHGENTHLQQFGNAVIPQPLLNNQASAEVSETKFMSNQEENRTSPWSGASSWDVLTIKTEDLGLASCEGSAANVNTVVTPLTPPATPSPAPTTVLEIPRGRPGRKPSANGPVRNNRKRKVEKGTEEYVDKRIRNNIAVRKSRDKAKEKQKDTEKRVDNLADENERLNKKVELLSKELNVLKSLFINVGASLPENFEKVLQDIMSK